MTFDKWWASLDRKDMAAHYDGFYEAITKWNGANKNSCRELWGIAQAALAPKRELVARKLVWVPSGETDVCADKEIAEIRILGSHSGKAARYGVRYDRFNNTWQVCFWCGNIGMWSSYRLPTIESAKSAAQDHYNSIVRENTQIEGGK